MFSDSPLTIQEIEIIDTTDLSSMEKHYLRLLAHCLAYYKEISGDLCEGPLPLETECKEWLLGKESLIDYPEFICTFIKQLAVAGHQLDAIARECNVSPLELTLQDLIQSSYKQKKHIKKSKNDSGCST